MVLESIHALIHYNWVARLFVKRKKRKRLVSPTHAMITLGQRERVYGDAMSYKRRKVMEINQSEGDKYENTYKRGRIWLLSINSEPVGAEWQ